MSKKKEEKQYSVHFFYDADLGRRGNMKDLVPIEAKIETKYKEKAIRSINELLDNCGKGTVTIIVQNKKGGFE